MKSDYRVHQSVEHIAPTQKLNVVVLGGSLSGLFAAIVLKRNGHNVQIFERSSSTALRDQGAGLTLYGAARDFLKKFDVIGKPITVPLSTVRILDPSGKEVMKRPADNQSTSWGFIHQTLRENFDASTPDAGEGQFLYGHNVNHVEEEDGHHLISFETAQGRHDTVLADLVIGADGPSSQIRHLFFPHIDNTYAGYVVWRGTVIEDMATPTMRDAFQDANCVYYGDRTHAISYTIPGENGSLEYGKRAINWAWYVNYNAAGLKEILTDEDGKCHRSSVPPGKVKPDIVEKIKALASVVLSPQYAELVSMTTSPFIQVIHDVMSPQNSFFDSKILLVGDAVGHARPHIGAGTSAGAFHALKLDQMLKGTISADEWSRDTMAYSKDLNDLGCDMGVFLLTEGNKSIEYKMRRHREAIVRLTQILGQWEP